MACGDMNKGMCNLSFSPLCAQIVLIKTNFVAEEGYNLLIE